MTPAPASRPSCSYCHLPLPRSWRKTGDDLCDEPVYCCVGCRIAAAVTSAEGEEGAARWMIARLGFGLFFTMNVMVFSMALWSRDLYGQDTHALTDSLSDLFRYLALLFAVPVLFLLGGPIFSSAWQALRRGNWTTDVLIVAGVVAAYVYSAVSVISGEGHVYFEVGCMVLVLVTVGRWLEASGKLRTNNALDSLEQLLPDTLRRVTGVEHRIVPRESIRRGDRVRILAGERFAIDGHIVAGQGDVDEQLLSGESLPIGKGPGDTVYSGTLNLDGDLTVRVTAAAGEETVSRFVQLVKEAREQQSGYQNLADRITRWFVPATWLVALTTVWYHTQYSGIEAGILAGLSVVLIACPCALGLATPMAVWAALGRAATAQVLFRSGTVLERLAEIRALRFDKTGTLTTGFAVVKHFEHDENTEPQMVLARAAGLATASNHPLSQAIVRNVADVTRPVQPRDAIHVAGRGVSAGVDAASDRIYLGSVPWMQESLQAVGDRLTAYLDMALKDGEPVACIGWGGQVRGVFVFHEQLRPHARTAIARCRQMGIDVSVLTGDHRSRADKIAAALDVDVCASQSPKDKVKALGEAQRRIGPTAMVGDGINDAPALAASDVGIAMGCGADLSRDAAGVCLLSDDLLRLPWTILLARKTVRVIRQNLCWAFAYNTIGIGLAACGKLNPILAALAMAISSLLVVTNSMRLAQYPQPANDAVCETSFDSFVPPPKPDVIYTSDDPAPFVEVVRS